VRRGQTCAVRSLYDAGRSDNFDSAADFAANDIFAQRPELGRNLT